MLNIINKSNLNEPYDSWADAFCLLLILYDHSYCSRVFCPARWRISKACRYVLFAFWAGFSLQVRSVSGPQKNFEVREVGGWIRLWYGFLSIHYVISLTTILIHYRYSTDSVQHLLPLWPEFTAQMRSLPLHPSYSLHDEATQQKLLRRRRLSSSLSRDAFRHLASELLNYTSHILEHMPIQDGRWIPDHTIFRHGNSRLPLSDKRHRLY